MIDVKLLLKDFDLVARALARRGVDSRQLEMLQALAMRLKSQKQHLESLQEVQNTRSKLFGQMRAAKESSEIEEMRADLERNKGAIIKAQEVVRSIEEELDSVLFSIPNIPDEHTPDGSDERDNVHIRSVLTPRSFDFKPKEHFELAKKNGWIDFAAGVKLAKSRFSVLRGQGALLSRALINFMIDENLKAGFELVSTPVIVNANMLFGTGQLPKFEEDMFALADTQDDIEISECPGGQEQLDSSKHAKGHKLYLISTAEITLTNLYNDCIIQASDLPIMLSAQTPCFRKEAGSAGRDTHGIIRQHQFDKVELVAITHPKESSAMQEKMVQTASTILEKLALPHRLMRLCSGDLGFSASNTIDIEVWLPGQACYREISSISNTRDFQARRAKIRYKEQGKNMFAHTLNGSSLAVGRTIVAIMENYQQADGSILIPEVLQPYMASHLDSRGLHGRS